ncbi:MAG: hypothetical protein ACYDGN_11410 [Acidimicrobiales bacterium]
MRTRATQVSWRVGIRRARRLRSLDGGGITLDARSHCLEALVDLLEDS